VLREWSVIDEGLWNLSDEARQFLIAETVAASIEQCLPSST